MNTIEASNGRWEHIYDILGLPPKTGIAHYKGPCPLCGKRNHFRFDDRSGDGDWICTCDNGKGLELVQEVFQIGFTEACQKVDAIIGNTSNMVPSPTVRINKHELLFNGAGTILGSQGEDYLTSRGITSMPPFDKIRFHPRVEYDFATGRSYGALATKMESFGGTFSYIHYTYLQGGRKIVEIPERKIFSLNQGGKGACVKLFPVLDTLGVAEGLETSLSAAQMHDIPVWATLNTSFLKKFVAPKGVTRLVVFSDNDGNLSGQSAAFECARRNMLAPNDIQEISIVWPVKINTDFNDALLANDYSIVKQKFYK